MRLRMSCAAVALSATALLTSPPLANADPGGGSFTGCPVLSEGHSTGPCVEQLQNDLNVINPGYSLTVDGIFGASTRVAVLDVQGRNHLGADGIVGFQTASIVTSQSMRLGSVATPGAGALLTAQQRCDILGDYVPYGSNRCVRDGTVPGGLSPLDCLKEEVGAKAYEDAVSNGLDEAAARDAAKKAVEKAGVALSVYGITKCMFVELDPGAVKMYESVPMP